MKKLLRAITLSLPVIALPALGHAIPASYGEATHKTTAWQELNDALNPNDSYGVSWTTDNGLTWGRDELFVGQTVQFKFNMHKKNVGTHYADHLAAWLDWEQDGQFDSDDQIAYGEHVIATEKDQVNTDVEDALGSYRTPDTPNITFFSNDFLLGAEHTGETWLRAQVTCSHSIVKANGDGWNTQWNNYYTSNYQNLFNPTGHYYQGETEEWKVTVHNVAEPGSLALLGLGLAGLASARRFKK